MLIKLVSRGFMYLDWHLCLVRAHVVVVSIVEGTAGALVFLAACFHEQYANLPHNFPFFVFC